MECNGTKIVMFAVIPGGKKKQKSQKIELTHERKCKNFNLICIYE